MPKKDDGSGRPPLRIARPAVPDLDALAATALGFLAADPERLQRFLAVTGLAPATLRGAAADPGFSLAVLTHICDDDRLLLAFAADAGLDPEAVGRLVAGETERRAWTDP